MKKLVIACVALSMSAFAFAVQPAATPAPAAKTAQQSKMVTCNADAAGKKGDERKTFMKECLSAKPAKEPTAQQMKMKTCNADAAGKKGDERKAFMKTCLSAAK
ncbi:MAG: PsiF family protein [Pseudomonadota bacterium]